MQFVFNNHSEKSGIYKIFNNHTNRTYIGSTKDFKKRWQEHRKTLLYGKHCNKFLQNDYNQCFKELSHDDFLVFEIIEVTDGMTTKQRRLIEQKYVAQYYDNQINCYNIKDKTIQNEPAYWSSTPEESLVKLKTSIKSSWCTEEAMERKRELSERYKKLWQNPEYRERMKLIRTGQKRTEETKQKLREQKLGNKNPMYKKVVSKETREKMSKAHKGKKLKPLYGKKRKGNSCFASCKKQD